MRRASPAAMPPEIDARNLICPLPVLRLRKALGGLEPGGCIVLVATDPMARIDVPHFCAEQGHALISVEERGGGALGFIIRKGG